MDFPSNSFGEVYKTKWLDNLQTYIEVRFGHLNAMIFRACRLVVDTGLHAFGWSRCLDTVHNYLELIFRIIHCKEHNIPLNKILIFRERAIEYMLEHTARTRDNIEREVNR